VTSIDYGGVASAEASPDRVKMSNLRLVHIIREPRIETGSASPLLVLLHGYGANERQMFELVQDFDPRLCIIGVRAPIAVAEDSHIWTEVTLTPDGFAFDEQGALQALMQLIAFIREAVREYGIDEERVYLMGFSQGAAFAGVAALLEPNLIAGAVLIGAPIPPEVLALGINRDGLADLGILLAHGIDDESVPVALVRAARDMLAELPLRLTYREYQMGHGISGECLADIRDWVNTELDRRRATPPSGNLAT
jgi:phospholipase/carboxylesterase